MRHARQDKRLLLFCRKDALNARSFAYARVDGVRNSPER